jgi:hypothetical protein
MPTFLFIILELLAAGMGIFVWQFMHMDQSSIELEHSKRFALAVLTFILVVLTVL